MFTETERLGQLLTHWRQGKQWTLGQLAQRSGVSKASLSRWEAERVQPRVRELEAVMDALELSEMLRVEAFQCIRAVRATRRVAFSNSPVPLRDERDAYPWGGLPRTGELLYALRNRVGYTQTEVAALLGINQSSVARWESSTGFPTEDNVQSLCRVLKTTPAETEALVQGPLILPDLHGRDALEEAAARHERLVQDAVFGNWNTADLAFFQLEASLCSLASKRAAGLELLMQVYSSHARFLVWRGREREAKKYLRLLRKSRTDSELWRNGLSVPAQTGLILEAEPFIHSSHRSVQTVVYQLLRQQAMITDAEHQAWLFMTIAEGFAILGNVEEALAFSALSIAIPLPSGNRAEEPAALLFRAMVQIRLQSPANALADLDRIQWQPLTPAQYTLMEVIRARAFLMLGETFAASDAVQKGYSYIANSGMVVYKPCLDSVAEAL
jgi:transcriptional regulator with XRE-family HTH domain